MAGKQSFALDFDDTFTADPELWTRWIQLAQARGHKVYCVSSRYNDEGNINELKKALPGGVDIVLTYGRSKSTHVLSEEIEIDVWIDDCPDCIVDMDSMTRSIEQERQQYQKLMFDLRQEIAQLKKQIEVVGKAVTTTVEGPMMQTEIHRRNSVMFATEAERNAEQERLKNLHVCRRVLEEADYGHDFGHGRKCMCGMTETEFAMEHSDRLTTQTPFNHQCPRYGTSGFPHRNKKSVSPSRTVTLTLIVGESRPSAFALSQIGPNKICMRYPADISPCDATIEMKYDDNDDVFWWDGHLPDGVAIGNPWVKWEPTAPMRRGENNSED